MSSGIIAAIAYGLLAIFGGIMGYTKAKSKASLISGIVSGLLLLVGGAIASQGNPIGLILAAIISVVLVIVFVIRYFKTRKFMPAGLMIITGIVACIFIISAIQLPSA